MTIEPVLTKQQIKIVEKLANEIWRQHYIPVIGKAQVEYMLKNFQSEKALTEQIMQGFLYFLIKNDDNYVGYLSILPKKEELLLSKLYIKFSDRGKHFGRKAINFIENLAKEKKLYKITLTVNKNNTNSIKAYKKMGFVDIGAVIKDIGNGFVMDDYKMEKFLE